MKYFVKSNKWTKIDEIETWWKSNECGYTKSIVNAGVYSDDDKIRMEKCHDITVLEFIPITRELLKRGIEQLEVKDRDIAIKRANITNYYESVMEEVQRDQRINEKDCVTIYELAKEIQN